MNNKEKLSLLETMFDAEKGSLYEEMDLADSEYWDSLAIISFIALVDETFNKRVPAPMVKSAKTVGDLIKLME